MKAQIQCRVSSEHFRSDLKNLNLRNFETDFGGAYAWQDFDTVTEAREVLQKLYDDVDSSFSKDTLRIGNITLYICTDKSKFWHKEEDEQ